MMRPGRSVTKISIIFSVFVGILGCGCDIFGLERERQMIDSLKDAQRRQGWYIVVKEREIAYLDLETASLKSLYPDSLNVARSSFLGMASLDPRENKLAFVESLDLSSYSLIAFNLTERKREVLFQLPYLQGPRWSPVENRIALEERTTETDNRTSLYLYRLDNKDSFLLVNGGIKSGEFLFCWSPDGKRIVYQSDDDKIQIIDIASKQRRTLDAGWFPTWSPNGRFISYKSKENEYALYDLETNQKTAILRGDDVNRSLVWSPDSQYVVYSRLSGGLLNRATDALSVSDTYSDLYAMNVQSKATVMIYRHNGSIYPTDWGRLNSIPQ
ncbi:MAG: hypothetical protein ABSB66_05350 [Candidatus Acidiferrales bacterium]|jgi:Tol biopolymer transport system component